MYAQTLLPVANYIANNSPIKEHRKWGFSSKSELALFSSTKKTSESKICFRKSSNLALARCAAAGSETTREDEFDDGYYIRRCVELARKGVGYTSPNPMVGCVIVKDRKVVGEGFQPKPGQPHAEVFALRAAGELAENATAYVSLEPCNHYGRSPPCTEALIKAKVANVVVGMVDPNPIVASRGIKKLQEAGIKVKVGVEEEMCKRLIEGFSHRMLTGRPFLTLRYSMSLDGHMVNQLGEEATGCGGYYSKLLQENDAVILSSAALAERSVFPVSNEPGANQPHAFVPSKSPNSLTKIPALSSDVTSKLTVVTDKDSTLGPQTGQEGIQMLSLDKISLLDILEHCSHQGSCSVLLDLRGSDADFEDVLKEGFEQNLFQKVIVEVLPLFGGDQNRMSKYTDMKQKLNSLIPYVSGKTVLLEGYV